MAERAGGGIDIEVVGEEGAAIRRGGGGASGVDEDEGDRLIDSEHVQDVLPHMPPIEREQIISGRCPTCQWAPTRPRRGPGPPGRAVTGGCANRSAQVVAEAQIRVYG